MLVSKIDLSAAIEKELREYTNEVKVGLEKAKLKATRNGVKLIKSKSPIRTGRYQKGWTSKQVGTGRVIYNATDYQLTHLLEKGHASNWGGRVAGIPHIGPAEQEIIKEYEKDVEKVIKG